MITLQDLKDKIEDVEEQLKNKGYSINEININIDYMTKIDNIDFDFIEDSYHGIFIQLGILLTNGEYL